MATTTNTLTDPLKSTYTELSPSLNNYSATNQTQDYTRLSPSLNTLGAGAIDTTSRLDMSNPTLNQSI